MCAGAACSILLKKGWPKLPGQSVKRTLHACLPSGYAEGLHRPPLTGCEGQHVAELHSNMFAMKSIDFREEFWGRA